MTIKEHYFRKANNLIERLDDTEEDFQERPEELSSDSQKISYQIDNEGDIPTETAKAILSTYIDRCVEEGTKELGSDYGLDDVEGSYEIVQKEIERIAKQLKNYLKRGVQ